MNHSNIMKISKFIIPATFALSNISFAASDNIDESYKYNYDDGSYKEYNENYKYELYPYPGAGTPASIVVDDSATTANIQNAFAAEPLLQTFHIQVSTNHGNVSLTGQVDTDLQFEKAATVAASFEGVEDLITTNLKIKASEKPMTDMLLTARVKGALIKSKFWDKKDIAIWPLDFETKNQTLYITGDVVSQAEKDNILKVVRSVKGVGTIHEDIKIKAELNKPVIE